MEWLNFFINNPITLGMAETLLHFIWQGSLLALILYVLLRNIDVRHSDMRYCISLTVLVLCVFTPIITFYTVYQPNVALNNVDVTQAISGVSETATQLGTTLLTFNDASPALWTLAMTELGQQIHQFQLQPMLPFIAFAWMAGVVLLSARLILQVFNVYQLPYQNTCAPDAKLQNTFERLIQQLGVNPVTRLLISHKVDVPMVIGWLKPVVLLPSSMLVGLAPNQLEMLLAHELAHVRRHDYVVNFLQTLVEVMLFFHPGVKWVSKQIRAERENCCDDVAVSHCGNAVAYATALTDAEMSRFTNIPQLAMAASGSDLKKRVFRIVGHTDCTPGATKHKFTGLLAGIVSLTIISMVFPVQNATGMPHTDSLNKNNDALVMIAPSRPVEASGNKAQGKQTVKSETESAGSELTATAALNVTQSVNAGVKEKRQPQATQTQFADVELSSSADAPDISEILKIGETTEITDMPETTETSGSAPEEVASVGNDSDDTQTAKKQDVLQHAKVQQADSNKMVSASTERPTETTAKTPERVLASKNESVNVKGQGADNDTKTDSVDVISQESSAKTTSDDFGISQQSEEKRREQVALVTRKAPVLISSDNPDYPRRALMRNLTADVRVSFVVDTNGHVEEIAFEPGTQRIFRNSVRRALSKWRFEPATENGKAVPEEVTRVFSFTDPDQDSLSITGSRIVRLNN